MVSKSQQSSFFVANDNLFSCLIGFASFLAGSLGVVMPVLHIPNSHYLLRY